MTTPIQTDKDDTTVFDLANCQVANVKGELLQSRAHELKSLVEDALPQLVAFVQAADDEIVSHKRASALNTTTTNEINKASYHTSSQQQSVSSVPTSSHRPIEELSSTLSTILSLPGSQTRASLPERQQHIHDIVEALLNYSVNTSSPGFLDKLYSAPCPPGIIAELILGVLNTNVHVFSVSPVLTLIEKTVGRKLAEMFGLRMHEDVSEDERSWRHSKPYPGGISTQGGSASNMTSIVVARNTLHPDTKTQGKSAKGLELVLFTSEHAHYSIEKAAVACGFGSRAVISVPTDPTTGAMLPTELERSIIEAKENGKTPFYVNVTAGTTVLGSFDPADAIANVARKHHLWMHVDGAWGGSFVFSETLRKQKLQGCGLADSIAINPHKMLGVPVTCSFLLARDLWTFQESNTLKAGYLFHADDDDSDSSDEDEEESSPSVQASARQKTNGYEEDEEWQPPNDLADMTLQCGRRGDSLKLFLAWQYYGTDGYRQKIENAYQIAIHTASLVQKRRDFILVSQNPPPCLQVCFYFAPEGRAVFGEQEEMSQIWPRSVMKLADHAARRDKVGKLNSKVTERIAKALTLRGFMIDHAPALNGSEHMGKFFRVVVNIQTQKETMDVLLELVQELGSEVVAGLRNKYQG